MIYKRILYRENRLRLIWTLLALVLLVILSEILVVDPIGALLLRIGFSESTHVVEHEWSAAAYDIIKRLVRSVMVLLSIWLPVRFMLGHRFQFTGYRFSPRWLIQLGLGICLGFIVQIIPLLLMSILDWYTVEGWLWNYQPVSVLVPAILFSFMFSTETAIIEESLFRGFFMNALAERYNIGIGLVASSILFGLVHFSGFSGEFPWWLSLISATVGGFVFGQAYLLFGNIWVPLGIHFGIHFAARTLGTVGVSPADATLLITHVEGPVMLVVTKAGGASLFELLGYGTISALMVLIRRQRRPISRWSGLSLQ